LIVLRDNHPTIPLPSAEIRNTKVLLTVMDGKDTYRDKDFQ
jgi:hypothetical protein